MTTAKKQYDANSPELRVAAISVNLLHFFKVIHDQLSITYFGILLTVKGENPVYRESFKELCQQCGIKAEHIDDEFVAEFDASLTDSSVKNAEAAVAASSLVFAHSVTENLLMDICKISADIDLPAWTSKFGKKKIPFEEVENKAIADLKNELIEKYFEQLEKESMPKKLDVLLSVIQPHTFAAPLMKKYDRERIVEIDRLRQELVHDGKFTVRISNIKEHLDYLYETTILFIDLFCNKYGIENIHKKANQLMDFAGKTHID